MKMFLLLMTAFFLFQCTSKKESPSETLELTELSAEQAQDYLNESKQIAQASFKALSSELKEAMKSGGPSKAVDYCSVEALPLTDSLSRNFDVQIRRTSLKYRNPQNAPDEVEKLQLLAYEKAILEGNTLSPKAFDLGDHVLTTIPISLKSECLACHGSLDSTLPHVQRIAEQYPEDKATDYSEGDLRGMWSIRFKVK